MKLFPLKYMDVYFNEQSKILEYHWKQNSENMTADEYKKTVEDLLSIVKTYEPVYMIGDSTEQNFVLNKEVIDWLKETVLEKFFQYGVERYAFVSSKNMFIVMAYEQLFMETGYDIKFFNSRDDAVEWLTSQ